jgi:hypothetical protein
MQSVLEPIVEAPPETRVIVFLGRIPSKKNGQQIARAGKQSFITSSKKHKAWEANAIADDLYGVAPITWLKVEAELVIYSPDLIRADLSNKWESIADVLVKAKILADDSWFVLPAIKPIFGGVDREHPRGVLTVWPGSVVDNPSQLDSDIRRYGRKETANRYRKYLEVLSRG